MVLKRFIHFSQNVGAFRNQSQHSRLSNQISTLTILSGTLQELAVTVGQEDWKADVSRK